MKTSKKFDNIYGEVEIKEQNETTTIVILSDGTEKTLVTRFCNFSDEPLEIDLNAKKIIENRKIKLNQPKFSLREAMANANDNKKYDFLTKKYI